MAKNCVIIPSTRNKKGEVVESRLFKDLLSYSSNRADATRLYLVTKNDDFIKNWNPKLSLDDNGEPKLTSLLKETNISKVITESKVLQKLNKDIGHYNNKGTVKLTINNDANYNELLRKAIQFNTGSDFRENYVASVERVLDGETNKVYIAPVIKRKDRMSSINAANMTYNYNLNQRLRDILTAKGISVGALTNLENRRGIAGVTDFGQAKDVATGLIEMIRLAEGIKGEKALPEEFAHFAIEAMGDNALVSRLINYIADKGLIAEIIGDDYSTYFTLYEGNEYKLAKEAAGKLLSKHLLQAEEIPAKPYRSLLDRAITSIKNFFKSLSGTQIQKAMYEADKDFGKLAVDILTGSLDNQINVDNINSSELYFSTQERVARDQKLLQNVIEEELKRLKIYEARNPNSQFNTNQRLMIDKLEMDLMSNTEIEGIYSYATTALEELEKVNNRLSVLANTPATSLNERAAVLRDVRNYIYSYSSIIKSIREALVDEENFEDNRYGSRVRVVLDNVTTLIDDLYIKYTKSAMPVFVDFIKPFTGESIVVPFGKYQGKTTTAEELVKIADKDISFFDRWLDSMADSSDTMLKVMDQAVKKSKEQARLRTIDVQKILESALIKLEQSGVKNTEWMFERNSKGEKTGKYISDVNQSLFKERMSAMFKDLNERYGRNPVGEDAENYKKDRQAWFDSNMEIVNNKKIPKLSIYTSLDFQRLTTAQRQYYDTVMDIKAKLDSYLPDKYTKLTNTIKIRKDLIERVLSSNVGGGTKQIWESIKDQFIKRTDDTDFGDKATVIDFEKREVQMLPIYYTSLKEGESENDISSDVTSTMVAYAAMANDFDEMNKVINTLELGRDMLREREITQTRGGKPLVEKFKSLGRQVENKLTKTGDKSRFIERLNDFFEMQVYGRYMADEGNIGGTNIDKGKAANFVNRMTSMNMLAINVLSGVSNIITGKVMMRIESMSGEFFNEKNTIKADREYSKELPSFLAEVGSRVKTSKLSLWNEKFNTLQEYESEARDKNYDRKSWFSKMFGANTLFFMNNAGEHWMQTRTSLALADTYKMKAPNGKIVSLWEAMEVVPLEGNKSLGAKMEIKKGYTKEDGSAFTNADIIKFSRKSAAINQRMHGIYNKADRSAVQRLAIGRMGFMFRKWIKPSLNRRFKSVNYNYDLEAWTEGFYSSTGRFLLNLARDLKQTQLDWSVIGKNWNNLNPTERANFKRAVTEVAHFLAVMAALGLIEWSDDEDRPWYEKMVEYQLRRLYTELGVMVPGPSTINEGLKILKSPAAGITTVQTTLDLIGLMNPFNYEFINGEDALIESGKLKGYSEAQRLLLRSPLAPFRKNIIRGIDPEEAIPFFKQ